MFTLPNLTYSYEALEPYLSSQTLTIHHTKHHQAYVNKLNELLADFPDFLALSVEDLVKNLAQVPENIRTAVTNNAGQVYNHNLYWQTISPQAGGTPTGNLSEAINDTFGSFENFQTEFSNLGATQFGSGWVWLSLDADNSLVAEKTSNADSPLMHNKKPILTMDVWEHAYYLNYQNKRPDYIVAFWNLINWAEAEKRFLKLTA